jgi:hypothetical protein
MAKKRKSTSYVTLADNQRYEAEEDLRCWMRVTEIRKDPSRRKRVHQLALDRLETAKTAVAASRLVERSKGAK